MIWSNLIELTGIGSKNSWGSVIWIQRHPHSQRFHVCGEESTKQQPSASKKRTRELFCYVKFPPCGSLAVVGGGHTCSFWWTIRNNPLVPSSARKKSPIYENKKKPCSSCTFSFFILLPLTRPPYCLRATISFLTKFSFFVSIFLDITIFFC